MSRILEGRNSATDAEAASFVDKFEEFQRRIEALKVEHLNRCRAVRQEMAELLDDAKSQGVAKGDVKDAAKHRKLTRDAQALLEDRDDGSRLKGILEALGDFAGSPLGAAALRQDEKANGGVDPIAAAADAAWNGAAPSPAN